MKDTIVATLPSSTLESERNEVRDLLDEYLDYENVIVKTEDMELHELPALDDYADELADRIAERIEEETHR